MEENDCEYRRNTVKLNYKRTFFLGLGFMSICAFWQLYDSIVPLILKNTFHINETITGGVMALDNVLALFLLPIFGSFSDRIDTRIGRRMPFILFGTIISVSAMMLLPLADQKSNLVLFIGGLFLVLLAMGTYRSPAVALMPDLTPKPLRSKANAVINLMGAVGGIITLGCIKAFVPGGEAPDYMFAFLAVAIIMVLSVGILVLTIREKQYRMDTEFAASEENQDEETESGDSKMPKEMKQSLCFLLASVALWFIAYNAVTSAFSRYAVEVWKLEGGKFADCLLVATGASIVSYIPIGLLSSYLGRKKTILMGIVLMSLSYFCGFIFKEYTPMINIVFAVTGIGWAAINVNSYPMVVEMSKGEDVGKYTGLYYSFSMSAQIITPILSGICLQYISYRTLFPYAFVFSLASFTTMIFVKHGDTIPLKKQSVLEHFEVED